MAFYSVDPSHMKYRTRNESSIVLKEKSNRYYDSLGKIYNALMFIFPFWKKWISSVLPEIKGANLLEVSFGTGYLLEKCASRFNCYGIEINQAMLNRTHKRLRRKNLQAELVLADALSLPFDNKSFDCIINTMALSGYSDGAKALDEMLRVLKDNGKLLIVDFNYPLDRNILGFTITKIMDNSGDIIKDIEKLLLNRRVKYQDKTIGGFGSVHLYIITKGITNENT